MESYDTLVVGAGMAGIAAAICAANRGARVLLLERAAQAGGNVSLANVHTFCGLYLPASHGEFVFANPGFPEGFVNGLQKSGGAQAPEIHGRVCVLPIYPNIVAQYAQKLCEQTSNLDLVLCATLNEIIIHGDQAQASFNHRGEQKKIRCTNVLDTSGDAAAAVLAGADTQAPSSAELQTATLIFKVAGAPPESLAGYSRLKLSAVVTRGAMLGDLPRNCDSVLVRPAEHDGEAFISMNLEKPDAVYAPLDEHFMRAYQENAHQMAMQLIDFLRQKADGWNDCKLLAWPAKIGVRESRQILGRTVLTGNDILTGKQYADQVALSTWPIELWNHYRGADFRYTEQPASIPLSTLVSRSHSNLGAAGRCMSGTHEALGALRVLGTAMATGQAVGIAAAIAADTGHPLASITAEQVNKTIHSMDCF